jgi:putative transposase
MGSAALLRGRVSGIGNWYVVTSVCHRRSDRFAGLEPAAIVVDELRLSDARGATESLAWVVMPDHLHWLLRLSAGTLAQAVQGFKSRSAHRISRMSGEPGRVWQAGYYDHLVRDEAALRKHARYLLDNPRRRGLATRFEDYPHAWCRWASCTDELW